MSGTSVALHHSQTRACRATMPHDGHRTSPASGTSSSSTGPGGGAAGGGGTSGRVDSGASGTLIKCPHWHFPVWPARASGSWYVLPQ